MITHRHGKRERAHMHAHPCTHTHIHKCMHARNDTCSQAHMLLHTYILHVNIHATRTGKEREHAQSYTHTHTHSTAPTCTIYTETNTQTRMYVPPRKHTCCCKHISYVSAHTLTHTFPLTCSQAWRARAPADSGQRHPVYIDEIISNQSSSHTQNFQHSKYNCHIHA